MSGKAIKSLKTALDGWIKQYNQNYLYSVLGYKSPKSVDSKYYETQKIQLFNLF